MPYLHQETHWPCWYPAPHTRHSHSPHTRTDPAGISWSWYSSLSVSARTQALPTGPVPVAVQWPTFPGPAWGHLVPAWPGPAWLRQGHHRGPALALSVLFITRTKREGLKTLLARNLCHILGFKSATRNTNSKTFPSDTPSTTTLPHTPYFKFMYFYVTSYVICRVLSRRMPNWQLVLGDFPQMKTVATDRRPQADSQTDRVPDKLYYYYYDILFFYFIFFCCWIVIFMIKCYCFLLHHYYVTLPTPQTLTRNKRSNESSLLYLYCYLLIKQIGLVSIWCHDRYLALNLPSHLHYFKWHRGDSL